MKNYLHLILKSTCAALLLTALSVGAVFASNTQSDRPLPHDDPALLARLDTLEKSVESLSKDIAKVLKAVQLLTELQKDKAPATDVQKK